MSVIRSLRQVTLGDASLRIARLLHRDFCVRYVDLENVVVDERLTTPKLGRGLPQGRSRVMIVLEGNGCMRDGAGREWSIGEGSVAFIRDVSEPLVRLETRCRLVEIDWAPGRGPPVASTEVFSLRGLSEVDVAGRLLGGGDAQTDDVLRLLAGRLRAEGLPLDLADAEDPERFHHLQRFSASLDHVLSSLHDGPMRLDLQAAFGVSERTVSRWMVEYNRALGLSGFGGDDWRASLLFWRLGVSVLLLSSPGVRARDVAARAGYGSLEALHHAFHRAGLDSPAKLARDIRRTS